MTWADLLWLAMEKVSIQPALRLATNSGKQAQVKSWCDKESVTNGLPLTFMLGLKFSVAVRKSSFTSLGLVERDVYSRQGHFVQASTDYLKKSSLTAKAAELN